MQIYYYIYKEITGYHNPELMSPVPQFSIALTKAAAAPHRDDDDRRTPHGPAAQIVNVKIMHLVGAVGT